MSVTELSGPDLIIERPPSYCWNIADRGITKQTNLTMSKNVRHCASSTAVPITECITRTDGLQSKDWAHSLHFPPTRIYTWCYLLPAARGKPIGSVIRKICDLDRLPSENLIKILPCNTILFLSEMEKKIHIKKCFQFLAEIGWLMLIHVFNQFEWQQVG